MARTVFALVLLAVSSASAFTAGAASSQACASRVSSVSMMPVQDFSGKKYGVPIFLPSGNVNPAYLAAEKKSKASAKVVNFNSFEKKKAKQIAKGTYDIADFIKDRIGNIYKEGYFPGKGGL